MLTRRRFLNLTLGTTVLTLSKPLTCSTPASLDRGSIKRRCLKVISAALEGAVRPRARYHSTITRGDHSTRPGAHWASSTPILPLRARK